MSEQKEGLLTHKAAASDEETGAVTGDDDVLADIAGVTLQDAPQEFTLNALFLRRMRAIWRLGVPSCWCSISRK